MSKNYHSIETVEGIKFYRINNCINGNPRYVVHFLDFLGEKEKHADNYQTALLRSRKVGGKMYRAKWFGGGIVLSSYNLHETAKQIKACI